MEKFDKFNVKFLSIISYIGPLFLIGKFSVEKDSDQVRFHSKQGEILFYTMSCLSLIVLILQLTLSSLFETIEIICLLSYIAIGVAWLILLIMGISGAISSKMIYIPIIGDIVKKIIKD